MVLAAALLLVGCGGGGGGDDRAKPESTVPTGMATSWGWLSAEDQAAACDHIDEIGVDEAADQFQELDGNDTTAAHAAMVSFLTDACD